MTTLELAALIATYALAATRLLTMTRPLWDRLPHWAQLALPALLISLPQLAGALGLVDTKLELVEAVGQAVVAVLIAIRGYTPKAEAAALLLALSFGASGCSGSLEANRAAGSTARAAGTMKAPATSRCAILDDRRAFYGGTAKVGLALAGGAGLSTIPLDDSDDQRAARIGLAAGGVAAAAIAAGALFVSESAGESWARECQ